MATWNTAYESLPENANNPGRGAEAIREFKSQVRTRQEIEHFFGPNEDEEASRFGLHKEGSARITSTDQYSASGDRDPALGDELSAGRVNMDSLDRTGGDVKLYEGNVEAQAPAGKFAADDRRFKKLEVLAYEDNAGGTPAWFPIFDIDGLVDLKFDQTIDGRKTFELEPKLPEAPSIKIGSVDQAIPSWFTATFRGATVAEKSITAQVANVADQLDNMMLSNILDPTDSLVVDHLNVLNTSYISDGRVAKDINVRSIKAGTIDGDSITGAVYI